jgi:hypothetical protein
VKDHAGFRRRRAIFRWDHRLVVYESVLNNVKRVSKLPLPRSCLGIERRRSDRGSFGVSFQVHTPTYIRHSTTVGGNPVGAKMGARWWWQESSG